MSDEVKCKTHPDAPHGFNRNASHSSNRYVCDCEGWEPEDNMREITNDEWNSLIINFQENQFYDCTLAECLERFIFDYGVLMEKAKNENLVANDIEEDTNRKINNLWDYIRKLEDKLNGLQYEFNNHKMHSTIWNHPKPYYGLSDVGLKIEPHNISYNPLDSVNMSTTVTSGYLQTEEFPTQEVDPRYKEKTILGVR